MTDLDRMMNRTCKTSGCENTGILKSPLGMQVVYESGDAMNADQRCPECLDYISSAMLAVWQVVRDRQGSNVPLPETSDTFRTAGRTLLSLDARGLRMVASLGLAATRGM